MGEKLAILKLKLRWKSVRAMILATDGTTIWNFPKKKETTGLLSNKHQTDRARKISLVDDRNIVRQ